MMKIRKAGESDLAFIKDSWVGSYWKIHAKSHIPKEVYFQEQRSHIETLLCDSELLVACFPEVPDEILGWACIEHETCHFVYTKSIYRRGGVGRLLLCRNKVRWYSHQTNEVGKAFARAVNMCFNPYTRMRHETLPCAIRKHG